MKYGRLIIIILFYFFICLCVLNSAKENVPKDIINEKDVFTDEELIEELKQHMIKNDYDDYAIKLINSSLSNYKKLFTNEEIIRIFRRITQITINPYNPDLPDLPYLKRAYNESGKITINCFENELNGAENNDELQKLLNHEIMHSLGEFPKTNIANSFNVSVYTRNDLLEEGLVNSISYFLNNLEFKNRFAIISQEEFRMYNVVDDNMIDVNSNITHSYTISGNIINLFKYIGCYEETIDSNMNKNFDGLKTCFSKNVNNGNYYFDELFTLLNKMAIYIEYPNTFLSENELIIKYENLNIENNVKKEIINFIKNNNLNDLMIEYAKLSNNIIENKIDNQYSKCDFYKKNSILYSYEDYNFNYYTDC